MSWIPLRRDEIDDVLFDVIESGTCFCRHCTLGIIGDLFDFAFAAMSEACEVFIHLDEGTCNAEHLRLLNHVGFANNIQNFNLIGNNGSRAFEAQ